MAVGPLRFLYVGTDDTAASVAHYTALGARLRWRFQHFGADVAAVELGDPAAPLVLLADHRPTGSVLPIFVVDDLDASISEARAAGAIVEGPLESPEGPAIVVRDPSGAEVALLRLDRPGAMDGAWNDEQNEHRVQ